MRNMARILCRQEHKYCPPFCFKYEINVSIMKPGSREVKLRWEQINTRPLKGKGRILGYLSSRRNKP